MKKFTTFFSILIALASVPAFAHHHHSSHDDSDEDDACAILFAGSDFDGPRAVIEADSDVRDLRDFRVNHHCESWNNQAGSMIVMPGCSVTAYQYLNFDINYNTGRQMGGQIRIFPNDGPRLRHIRFDEDGFYKLMSSLKCECR